MYTLSNFPRSFRISATFSALFRRAYLSLFGSPEALTSPLAGGSPISQVWCCLSSTLTLRSRLLLSFIFVKCAIQSILIHLFTLFCYLALPPFLFLVCTCREKISTPKHVSTKGLIIANILAFFYGLIYWENVLFVNVTSKL